MPAARATCPGHILTGPVAVEGAEPGDVLEVRIVDVRLRQDWGYNVIRPLAGTIPDDFDAYRHAQHSARRRAQCRRACRGGSSCRCIRSSASSAWRRRRTGGASTPIVPRAHGGNLDNKELRSGRYAVPAGARRGCAVFVRRRARARRATARSARRPSRPRCRALSSWSSTSACGLDVSARRDADALHHDGHASRPRPMPGDGAARHDRACSARRGGLSREDAYTLCSLAVDFRITQTVNVSRGVHAMLAKALIQ